MTWRRKESEDRPERPDVSKARGALERLIGQRPDVDDLIDDLHAERYANHFADNIRKVYMGRKA